ncbi:MAG: hypothetical protein ABH865_03050 [Candidatus Omnitrophota bacterium]
MQKLLIITGFLILSLTSSGCIPVLIGAAAVGTYQYTKKTSKRSSKLTEMQRRTIECKELEGTREDILRATITVFQDKGFSIQNSDYEGGIISAASEKPPLHVTASIEEFTSNRIKMRITMNDEEGVIEDKKLYAKIFDDIQTEAFRRVNLKR